MRDQPKCTNNRVQSCTYTRVRGQGHPPLFVCVGGGVDRPHVLISISAFEMSTSTSSSAWQSFSKIDDGQKVQCKLCDATLKFNGSTTSSMRSHIGRKHTASPTAASSAETKLNISKSSKVMAQFLGKAAISEKRRLEITSKIVEWLTSPLRPVSIVSDKGFVKFIRFLEPGYKAPSQPNMMATIYHHYKLLHAELVRILDKVDGIAVTTDQLSSSRSIAYSTYTGHYIDNS